MATHLEYMRAAMREAEFEELENGAWFASIPGFDGLWATGPTRESARYELYGTLDGWLDVHTKIGGFKAPVINGMSLESLPKLVEE
jgi:predicted RNase H-like HicB family nuclease